MFYDVLCLKSNPGFLLSERTYRVSSVIFCLVFWLQHRTSDATVIFCIMIAMVILCWWWWSVKMMMTNAGAHKRRRPACWLRGKTNREGVKGRMIGSRCQILQTNSNLFLRKSKSKYFQIQEEFQSQLAKSNKSRRQRKPFRCNKANLFGTKKLSKMSRYSNTKWNRFMFIE